MEVVIFEDEVWRITHLSGEVIILNKNKKVQFKINSDCVFEVGCGATICSNRWDLVKDLKATKKKGKKK